MKNKMPVLRRKVGDKMKKFLKNTFDLVFDIFLWFMILGCCGIVCAVVSVLPGYGVKCLVGSLAMVIIIKLQQKIKNKDNKED